VAEDVKASFNRRQPTNTLKANLLRLAFLRLPCCAVFNWLGYERLVGYKLSARWPAQWWGQAHQALGLWLGLWLSSKGGANDVGYVLG
jgi:hypothetical protein